MFSPDQETQIRELAREEARQAVASFAGLAMRRFQILAATETQQLADTPVSPVLEVHDVQRILGEALREFTVQPDEGPQAA
jgi:hypothetical protein